MVSSPGAGLERILGCARLRVGGGSVGTWPGPGEPGGRRRGPGGREGRGSLGERDLGWSRYREERSLPLLPGPVLLNPRGRRQGPPAFSGRSAGGRAGDGQSRTGVRRGSGANQSPTVGRRELGAVAFTAGICVRVVAVVLL